MAAEKVPSEREIFRICGPTYLTNIDWRNADHRRSVFASLVQGVSVQERDRQAKRTPAEAQAEPWWSFFGFQLAQVLRDHQSSIFGAVYQRNPAAGDANTPAPRKVLAFRGTMRKSATFKEDLKLDLRIISHGLHGTDRFRAAMDALRQHCGSGDGVILTGHSMGAALALLAGRQMAEERGLRIETHLFNPPFVSAPVDRIRDERVKHGLHLAGNVVAAGLALALKGKRGVAESDRSYFCLAEWVPSLYLNPRDDVCAGYIAYYRNHRFLHRIGAGRVSELAAQHSIGGLVLSACGVEAKAPHLIPSARLVVSLEAAPDLMRAHGIHQWLSPGLRVEHSECRIGNSA
eukprot:TRINITY_DN8105_c0_g1_i1.p1 TRINITY_DN8105_c0_g1~~TRINITY_DN8105_c0_g1_i1.p1  ORF type:complete len:366 (+),score=-31.58 TRINITY_DN8105_c0_g1_i1:59-1099(+)